MRSPSVAGVEFLISVPWVVRILAYPEEQGEAQSPWELDVTFLFPC